MFVYAFFINCTIPAFIAAILIINWNWNFTLYCGCRTSSLLTTDKPEITTLRSCPTKSVFDKPQQCFYKSR